jgi:hypothetical protein
LAILSRIRSCEKNLVWQPIGKPLNDLQEGKKKKTAQKVI